MGMAFGATDSLMEGKKAGEVDSWMQGALNTMISVSSGIIRRRPLKHIVLSSEVFPPCYGSPDRRCDSESSLRPAIISPSFIVFHQRYPRPSTS